MQKRAYNFSYRLLTLSASSLCLSVAVAFSASAQSDTAKKLKEVNIKTRPLPDIQTITPSQQISAADFDRYNAFNVADAVRDFAGVNIKDYGGIGGLKTVSVRSLGADHLAVLYDGVQINDAENGQIDLGRLNLENVQEITLYNGQPPEICQPARSFASASVLSIKTIHPNLSPVKPYEILLGVKGGSFGLINPYMQWQQRLSNNWSLIINSYWENANGRYKYKVNGDGSDTSSVRSNADLTALQTDGALYWTKSDSNKFNLHVNYYNSDRGLPGAVIFYNPVSHQRMWNRDIYLQSGYEHLWRNSLHLLMNAKLSQDYTHYTDPDFLNNTGGLNEKYTQREFYLSGALSYHLASGWELSYASDASINTLAANLYNYAYPTRLTWLNVLATNFTSGKWRLQGSLLNTNINESVKSGNAVPTRKIFSPTLMATYRPFSNSDLQLRAFYKDIFRNPTFDEQYYFTANGTRSLKPEFARQYDLGITCKKALNGFLEYITLTADGYYNTVTDKIVALPNQNPAISSIINLGKVDIKGVDAGIKTQTRLAGNWRWTLSVNYTYQDAIDVTDPTSSYYRQQIPYTPKNTFAVNGGFDYKRLGIYYNQVLSSSRYYLSNNTPENFVDGYSVSDVSVNYKFIFNDRNAALSLNLDNLFNTNYVIVRSFPMPGRSFILSFKTKI
ncbi:MAG: TonB-dependent receptor [Mucilaginibacter sp.]